MKRQVLFTLFSVVILLTSCQKDVEGVDNSSAANLFGDWKLTGMKMVSNTDVSMAGSGQNTRFIIGLNYTAPASTSGGTYTFAADKITATNVRYTPAGTAVMKMYSGGTLVQNETMPMESDPIVTNGSSNYKAVGSDSLFIPGGALLNVADPSNGAAARDVTTVPSGYKYKIEGKKLTLYLKMKGNIDMPPMQGYTFQYLVDWNGEIYLEKL